MTCSLVSRLEDLGACSQALDWVDARPGVKPSALWKDHDLEPEHMLWLLRRTCINYNSKRLRALAACLIELVSAAAEWRGFKPYEEKAKAQVQLFAECKLNTRELGVWLHQHKHTGLGNLYEVISTLCRSENEPYPHETKREPRSKYVEWAADKLSTCCSLPEQAQAREIILRHFPKPPRLS